MPCLTLAEQRSIALAHVIAAIAHPCRLSLEPALRAWLAVVPQEGPILICAAPDGADGAGPDGGGGSLKPCLAPVSVIRAALMANDDIIPSSVLDRIRIKTLGNKIAYRVRDSGIADSNQNLNQRYINNKCEILHTFSEKWSINLDQPTVLPPGAPR